MGGYGSGRRTRWASKSDEFHKVDLADFRSDWFERSFAGTLRWSRGGHPTGSVSYSLAGDHIRLTYSVSGQSGKLDVNERFELAFTEQPFGGKRRWIVCKCGRRCRVLYGGKYFRCRQCYRLTFASQYEPFHVPGLAKAENIRRRLGMQAGLLNPFGSKPKGMHWKTYRQLEALDRAAADTLCNAMWLNIARK